MLIGGLRALLVQGLEPRAMAAVDQHSAFREDPWGRLERTTQFVVATTYGDTEAAEAAAAIVRKVHEHIHGVDPVTGEAYAANDPDLLLWIHAVEVESFLLAYRTYAGRITADDGDRYVARDGTGRRDGRAPIRTVRRAPRVSCATTCCRSADCRRRRLRSRVCASCCSRPWT